jgi:hypothetical protein
MRAARYREPMARWKLALLVGITIFFVGFALSRAPELGLLFLALGWLSLCAASLRWGYDSRDGRDWDDRPERRRRPTSPEVRVPRTEEEKRTGGISPGPGPG